MSSAGGRRTPSPRPRPASPRPRAGAGTRTESPATSARSPRPQRGDRRRPRRIRDFRVGELRVGGGYAAVSASASSPSPRRNPRRSAKEMRPQERDLARSEVVADFRAPGVCAVEVLQGGAAVWTAEADGGICVRNGFTGEAAAPPKSVGDDHGPTIRSTGVGVVRLYATEQHMWVGCSDGSVRVYDHLVVVPVWPEEGDQPPKPHEASVEFFSSMYDGTVLSGDIEGNLVKWAGENAQVAGSDGQMAGEDEHQPRPFDILARGPADGGESPPGSRSLSALDTSGHIVYTGNRSGMVHALDGERLELLHSWDSLHRSVTALKSMAGFLFTGGSDCQMRVWQKASQGVPAGAIGHKAVDHGGRTPPLCTQSLDAAVTHLVCDMRAHQIWAVDESGRVTKFDSAPPFAERELGSSLPLMPAVDVAAFTSWDAVRVWSTGSNGANFSWFARWNRAEEQMQEAIENMKSIIAQDSQEMDKWQQMIDKLSKISADRKAKIAGVLGLFTDNGVRHLHFRRWQAFLHRLYEARRRSPLADLMMRNSVRYLRQLYYGHLVKYRVVQQRARQQQAIGENLLCCTVKGLKRVYWKKMDQFRHRKKKLEQRERILDVLFCTTEKGQMRRYFRKCQRYLIRTRNARKRREYASTLLRATDAGVRRIYYFRLVRHGHMLARRRRRDRIGQAMLMNSKWGVQRAYYRKFCAWGESQRRLEIRRKVADCLRRATTRGLLAVYQSKIDTFVEARRIGQREREVRQREAHLAGLRAREQAMQGRLQRRRQLDRLRQRRDELRGKRDELNGILDELGRERERLEEQKREKEEEEREMKQRAASLDSAMAKLKEKCLNYDADFDLISKTSDGLEAAGQPAKRGALDAGTPRNVEEKPPVIKKFLEAHMTVKQQLVQTTAGPGMEQSEQFWPLNEHLIEDVLHKRRAGDETWRSDIERQEAKGSQFGKPPWDLAGHFSKIKNFQYNQIGPNLKKMVILFDSMTQQDKDRIETDEEIVINATNLIRLCENAKRVKSGARQKEYEKPPIMKSMEPWKRAWAEYKGFQNWDEYLAGDRAASPARLGRTDSRKSAGTPPAPSLETT